MCFELLCTISMDEYYKSIIRPAQFKFYPHYKISCLSTHNTLYCAWNTPFQWKETVAIMWDFYRFNCYCKTLYQKRALWLRSNQLWTFIKTSAFLQLVYLHFTYHMYALLELITVETCATRHPRVIQIFNVCCAIVIIQNM